MGVEALERRGIPGAADPELERRPAVGQLVVDEPATDRALLFRRPLEIRMQGSVVATWAIETTRTDFETPEFDIPAGSSFLELTSLDGATAPGPDPRRLSVAVYSAELLQ